MIGPKSYWTTSNGRTPLLADSPATLPDVWNYPRFKLSFIMRIAKANDMGGAAFIVTRHRDGWTITQGADVHGPYDGQFAALLAAILLAQAAGEAGQAAKVFMQRSGGGHRLVWTYGQGRGAPVTKVWRGPGPKVR